MSKTRKIALALTLVVLFAIAAHMEHVDDEQYAAYCAAKVDAGEWPREVCGL